MLDDFLLFYSLFYVLIILCTVIWEAIFIIINAIIIYGYIEHKHCFILLFTMALKVFESVSQKSKIILNIYF